MATLRLASFQNESVVFELDYNDGNLKITQFRCVNNGDQNARGTLYGKDGQIIVQYIFNAGTTWYADIGGNWRVGFDQFGDPILPLNANFEYPAP